MCQMRKSQSGAGTTFSDPHHQATSSQLDRTCSTYHCLLKTALDGENGRKTDTGKTKRKMLDLHIEQEDKKISYQELKRRTAHRVEWHHHQLNLP